MKNQLLVILLFCFSIAGFAQKSALLKLKYEQNYTPTYFEAIEMFKLLDEHYENAVLLEKGFTDCGKPLHLFVINSEPEFNPEKIRLQGKTILLINNGIHAGEPEGIDASFEFADDILRNKDGMAKLLEKTVIIIIPVYNIGGVLNRSAYNRSGQTTPYETGFRGNFANLDLNRDFTKCDSENARSFSKIFTEWNPDVFLDTHTTNGSDHQYSITLIAPCAALFPSGMEKYIRNEFVPALYSEIQKVQFYAGDLIIPVRQEKIKYLLEMFEPKASDSFFRWNFFDNVLDQREYFSSYGFEANALKYLNEHPEFKSKFEEKRKTDPEFAKNHRAQLAYIYNNTEWLEKTWKRYPVGKIIK